MLIVLVVFGGCLVFSGTIAVLVLITSLVDRRRSRTRDRLGGRR